MENSAFKNFGFALKGIKVAIKEEAHMRFHLFMVILVITSSILFELSAFEWMIIILSIGLVLFAELVNSSIENLVDLVKPEHHALAGKIKDMAAGGVLICSITAAVLGAIVFWPHICSVLD